MKALVKREAGSGLRLEEVMEPTAGPDDVLIRVLRTAICGTDVHIYQWNDWAKATIPIPMVIGHEFVGEILEMGTNVRDYVPGTLVSGEGHIVCGRCRNCMAGRRHLCRHACGIGVDRQGAFAEYIAIPSANIWQHAAGIDLDVASIFDPFGNAAHTALQWDLVGEDVLITGAGPIGVMACAICRHAGARHVVISDVNEYRLLLASNLGATRTVNVRQERIADVQIELGMTEGFDIGLEMSGSEQALLELLDNMCHGGKVSILGIPNDNVAIDWRKVVFNMLTIKGIYGREIFETWYKMTVMLQSGLNLLPLITHRLPYTSFEEGFEAMLTGKAGKVVLTWE